MRWWPAKPQSVLIGAIFTVVWLTASIFLFPNFLDALIPELRAIISELRAIFGGGADKQETQTLRLVITGIVLALTVYWTAVGIQWCIDDWLGRKKEDGLQQSVQKFE
jgi:hypothetical protein